MASLVKVDIFSDFAKRAREGKGSRMKNAFARKNRVKTSTP
jgi:hypothetical protein